MLNIRFKTLLRVLPISVFAVLALLPQAAFAANNFLGIPLSPDTNIPDVTSMLESLQTNFISLSQLVAALCYVFAGYFMLTALLKLKKYGEGISMTAQKEFSGTLVSIVIGVAFLFIPSTLTTLLTTFYGTDTITAYTQLDQDGVTWELAMQTIVMIVQFVGVVAVVRGLFHLHKATHGQSQQNGFAKGVVHLIGGVLAVNIVATKDILYSTLGLAT